jgi:hypothetical protein
MTLWWLYDDFPYKNSDFTIRQHFAQTELVEYNLVSVGLSLFQQTGPVLREDAGGVGGAT